MINFNTTPEDSLTICRIAERAMKARPNLDGLLLAMDLTACHLNGTPLNLDELEHAPDIHFWHDIAGILRNINRDTGKLDNFFVPRYVLGETVRPGRDGVLTFKQRERQDRLRARQYAEERVPTDRRYDIVYAFGGERHTMRDVIPSDVLRAQEALKGQGAELVKTYYHGWGDYAP